MTMVKIRWAYFHIHPSYMKFKMSADSESYFQHSKTGEICCNFTWNDRAE